MPAASGPSNDRDAAAPGSTASAPGTSGRPGSGDGRGRQRPPCPGRPGTSARCGTQCDVGEDGHARARQRRAGGRADGPGRAGGRRARGRSSGSARRRSRGRWPSAPRRSGHRPEPPGARAGRSGSGGRGPPPSRARAAGPGAGGVPQPPGVGRSVLRGGVGETVAGVPAALVEAARVAEPEDPERAVGRLGVHPGHRLGEVVGRQVPAAGERRRRASAARPARRPAPPRP